MKPEGISTQLYVAVPTGTLSIPAKQQIDNVITPGELKLPPSGLTGITGTGRKPFLTRVIIDGYKARGFNCIPVEIRVAQDLTFNPKTKATVNPRVDIEDLQNGSVQVFQFDNARGGLTDYISRRWAEILKKAGAPAEEIYAWGAFITWRPDLLDELMSDELFAHIGAISYSAYDPQANEVMSFMTIYDPDVIIGVRPLRKELEIELPDRLFE